MVLGTTAFRDTRQLFLEGKDFYYEIETQIFPSSVCSICQQSTTSSRMAKRLHLLVRLLINNKLVDTAFTQGTFINNNNLQRIITYVNPRMIFM